MGLGLFGSSSGDADRNIKCQWSLGGADLFHFCLAASRAPLTLIFCSRQHVLKISALRKSVRGAVAGVPEEEPPNDRGVIRNIGRRSPNVKPVPFNQEAAFGLF